MVEQLIAQNNTHRCHALKAGPANTSSPPWQSPIPQGGPISPASPAPAPLSSVYLSHNRFLFLIVYLPPCKHCSGAGELCLDPSSSASWPRMCLRPSGRWCGHHVCSAINPPRGKLRLPLHGKAELLRKDVSGLASPSSWKRCKEDLFLKADEDGCAQGSSILPLLRRTEAGPRGRSSPSSLGFSVPSAAELGPESSVKSCCHQRALSAFSLRVWPLQASCREPVRGRQGCPVPPAEP